MEPDPGSWRDPSNRVLHADGRVLRVLDERGAADFDALRDTKFFPRGMAEGRIIATEQAATVPADLARQGWTAMLEHEVVPVISYPFEWSFSMLQDAAMLQLDLTEQALEEGLITKDATPYNVQFVGASPTFIDIGSFERVTRGEPWFGYRQFCEQFLNPLLLGAAGIPWRPWLRGAPRGITPEECRAALPLRRRARPSVFVHVGLHAWAERRYARSERDVRSEMGRAGLGPAVVRAQVKRLRRVVQRLRWKPAETAWSGYGDRGHYTDADLAAKEAFVLRVAAQRRRSQVIDLGANDGRFTDLVLPEADYAVAVDGDDVAVDQLYRRLRERDERRVLPLCLDLTDPTGPFGWRSRERPAFFERVTPSLVLFLAVIHHLAITRMVPLDEIVTMLAELDAEVVVEFPTPQDPMVTRIASAKKETQSLRYDTPVFEAALAGAFEVVEHESLPSGTRVMYHLRPRHG
jgi:hypothetical protein